MTIFDSIPVPKILFETTSPYNGKITVAQVGNNKKILVDGVKQSVSPDSKTAQNAVWGNVVTVLKENEPYLKRVLILGLGGGTMQHLISRKFPEAEIVSVEIDSVMVDIAKNYFDLDKIPNHRVIVGDACGVMVEPEKYGLKEHYFNAVVVDIYVGEVFPELGKSGNFIAACKKLIYPGGLMIFNRIYLQKHQEDVNQFVEIVEGFLSNVKTRVIAGVTNSDNVLIFGRT